MKTSVITLLASLMFLTVYGQDNNQLLLEDSEIRGVDPLLYALIGVVLIIIILSSVVVMLVGNALKFLNEQIERDRIIASGKVYIPKPSLLSRLVQKFNNSVPVEREQDIDLGHNYDGIRELDNYLPPWWKWLFYGTIAWAVAYLIVFHLFPVLPLSIEEYQLEVAAADESKARFLATRPQDAIDPDKLEFNNDPEIVANGKTLFANVSCVSCHRADGGGNSIGPNLTDNYWLHGGDVKNIFLTIKNGVVEKGMPAWGKSFSAGELRDLSFFILSLQDSKPVDPKAPQGDLFDPPVARNDSLSASLTQ